jgi:hypothetical protein
MDMHYYWLCDQHGQGQFNCHWKRGIYNLSDYQSKAHPIKHHIVQRPLFVGNNLVQIMANIFLTPQRQGVLDANPLTQGGSKTKQL